MCAHFHRHLHRTLTWYDLGQYPGGPSARAEAMMWAVAEDDAPLGCLVLRSRNRDLDTRGHDDDGAGAVARFGQFYFSRKTATAYELYIFGGATAEFAPVLLNDMWRLTIPFTVGRSH